MRNGEGGRGLRRRKVPVLQGSKYFTAQDHIFRLGRAKAKKGAPTLCAHCSLVSLSLSLSAVGPFPLSSRPNRNVSKGT